MRCFAFIGAAALISIPCGASAQNETAPPEAEHGAASCTTAIASIDKDFPTGAFADCRVLADNRIELTIAPEDPGKINCSAWYAFRITPREAKRITVKLDYTTCGHRYRPKTSTDGVNWKYLRSKDVTVEGKRGERTAELRLKLGKKPLFVAAQEITPPSVYDAWMDRVEKNPEVTRALLGKSAQGRDIERITIGNPDAREQVALFGRQHPPEVSGALAMFPFMETLMADTPLAQRFRERFLVTAVPLTNPDGVVLGYWRHSTGGVDLNRDWGPFTQPETRLLRDLLAAMDEDPEKDLRLMLDFHSTANDVFYTIPDELPTDPELFTAKWLARYEDRMGQYEVNRDARHKVGRPISKAYVYDTYGAPAVTFEIGDETDRKLIRKIGRESAIAMMEELLATPAQ